MKKTEKGRSFDGWFSGRMYEWGTGLAGLRLRFMRTAAMAMPLRPGMEVLDLGCGTAALGRAVAERVGPEGHVVGVDLAEKQLDYARFVTADSSVPFTFHQASMDALPFEPGSFDAVLSSLAFHEVPSEVRRGALTETARVLRPGGFFGLVDWSRPRFGLSALFWLPVLLFEHNSDNWKNTYPDLCQARGLIQETDVYIGSAIRCQVFRKETS